MSETLEELDYNEQEDRIIELPSLKPGERRRKKYIQELKHWRAIQDILFSEKGLMAVIDLFFAHARDIELYRGIIKQMADLPIGYPHGFKRELAFNVLEEIKKQNPQYLIEYANGLIKNAIATTKDLGFVVSEGKIIGSISFTEEEPEHSGFLQASTIGTADQKLIAALSIDKFFRMVYLEHWYNKGYRYIFANALGQKAKEFIRHVGRKEDNPYVFHSKDMHSTSRFDGKYPRIMSARWDLKQKFEQPHGLSKGKNK